MENTIPGCIAAINIYRIEGEPEQFINILRKPIYVNIALSKEKQDFNIQPEEFILLDPGRYFISFAVVDCDMDAIVLKIRQEGDACHEGYLSCFFRKINTKNEIDIDDLKEEDLEIILEKLVNPEDVYK